MALATQTRPAPFGAIATFNFVTRIENAYNALVAWNTQRKTVKVLSALSDRELNDIGLSRGDLNDLPTRF